MLGRVIDRMEPQELRRVLDVPVENWATRLYSGCLVGHALGDSLGLRPTIHEVLSAHKRWGGTPERDFDNLCARFGIPRVVRAIKQRALKALEQKVGKLEPVTVHQIQEVGA